MLTGALDQRLWYLPQWHAIIGVGEAECAESVITEVIAARLPPADVVLAALPQPGPARWSFPPDLLDPQAQPVPTPRGAGLVMVRGDRPADLGPIGLSLLWEH